MIQVVLTCLYFQMNLYQTEIIFGMYTQVFVRVDASMNGLRTVVSIFE